MKAAEPLISSKDAARTTGLNYVTSALKRGLRITQKDMQTTLGLNHSPESCINATPQDPEKCFSPQPGTIPVTDEPPIAPISQTLKERYTIPDLPPPLPKDAPMSEVLKRDALILAMSQADAKNSFTTAAVLLNGGLVTKPNPITIKKTLLTVHERDLMLDAVLERTQFTPKEIEIFDDIVKAGGYGCRYELFEEMVKKLEAP